jgi:hypothetical protein
MAILNAADRLTALEAVKRMDQPWPGRIIECLTHTNEIMLDMPAIECNKGTTHTIVQRTSLVKPHTRSYYEGTGSTATQTKTIQEPTGMWQDISRVDASLAEHTGDVAGFRKRESIGKLEGIGQGMAEDLIYGVRQGENGISGFASRYNKIDGKNCISMGGTGDNLTSIYIMALGERYVHLIYPRGFGTVGVKHTPMQERAMVLDEKALAAGEVKKYPAYEDLYEVQFGIAVEDPRAVVRLCNIDKAAVTPAELIGQILYCLRRLPVGAYTYVLYGNLDARDLIDEYARDKGNIVLPAQDPWGREMQMIQKLRVRTVEAIQTGEKLVS